MYIRHRFISTLMCVEHYITIYIIFLLLYIYIYIYIYIYNPLIFQGECRQLFFPAKFMFDDRRLMKHIIATIKVLDVDLCELQCYLQPNCVSINFNVIADSEGLHDCEFNNATHRSHEIDLQNKHGYVYKGAEVRNFDIQLCECELNNATHRSHNNELMNTNVYVYKGAEVRNLKTLELRFCA